MGLPTIDVIFKQLAITAIERSERGNVCLIVKDTLDLTNAVKKYKLASEIEVAKFSAENVQYITDCFHGKPESVTVIKIDEFAPFASALTIAATLDFDWIGIAEGATADQDALASWIKGMETQKKTYKAVVYNPATNPDSMRVVNFTNSKINFADARGEVTGEKYIATLLGILAGLPLNKSATYYVCSNLTSVVEPANIDTTIDAGKLVLINDYNKVRIGAGINSLTTIDTNNTESMKQIIIVESMDLIANDIRHTFKENYVGKYKNKYDNQILLLSAIKSYFDSLEDDDILDVAYDNSVNVDVETQRQAWLGIGKVEATTWTQAQVKNNTFRNNVYLNADVKILGAIENVQLNVNLF